MASPRVLLSAVLSAGCLLTLVAPAEAVVPRKVKLEAPALTALPSSGIAKPLRAQKKLAWGQALPSAAWKKFVGMRPDAWHAAWDAATGVPSRIYGAGMPAPGAVGSAAIAETFARRVLADHIALLAPGASVSDFELVSNQEAGGMRSVGFVQRSGGLRVVGGQVSFRFKADRLFVIGSEALPNVSFTVPTTRAAQTQLRARATTILKAELGLPNGVVSPIGDEVVLPLVADDAVLGYRLARPITIDGGVDGRYLAYADAATGAVIAVRQMNAYATGTVLYHTVDRYPGKGHIDRPAPRAFVSVNGAGQTTTMTGAVTWEPAASSEVVTSVEGDLVKVVTKAVDNPTAMAVFALSPGGSLAWDASSAEFDDAQVNAYVAANIAKEYVRTNLDANMPTIDDQIQVNVNLAQNCNAFFDGAALNFFQANESCQNTALILDVVYHEYGHRVHTAEIIPGVGDFDGSMSEGAADFLAASITGDAGMGRGFFFFDEPLRDLDPADAEWLWPQDIAEIHHTGMIFGGTFWDLRKALIAEKGEAAGIAIVNKLYLGALRRSINIPTSLVEVLAEDDDDGNLENGTPNECTIRAAFGRHGMRTASGTVIAPGTLAVPALAIGVHINISGLSERCPGDEPVSAELSWVPGYTGTPRAGTTVATPAGPNTYFAQLPLATQESVFYKVRVKFGDNSTMTLADNLADAYYQLYQGETVKLYCTDFDSTNPFSEGWTTGVDDGTPSPFEWGIPTAGATDPHGAFSGFKIMAQRLDGNYLPKQRAWVKTPPIDVGQYSDVRLQYRRWLAVEDSHFDTAMITANDKKAWVNFTGDIGDASAMHHVDKEWRFHDVPLSGYFSGHTVTVGWEITSVPGLELGGWQLDDVCVVANPYSVCGDGVKSGSEQCDTGTANRDAPNVCRTDCRIPTCGDGIVDNEEECDVGPMGDYVCSPQCKAIGPVDDGCCSSSGRPGSLLLAGLVGGLLLRRRRRRR
jgi:hypothetical protein